MQEEEPWGVDAVGIEEIKEKLPYPLPERDRIAPDGVEILKQTRSICPQCMAIIDADVGIDEEDGKVYMYKTCPEHGEVKGYVESNVDFYRTVMNTAPVNRMPLSTLIFPVTHRCNLACKLCFVPKRDRDELDFRAVRQVINAFPGRTIALSGGEPTLREDLTRIIRYIRTTGRRCHMLTNAIELADPSRLAELVDAGLQHVLFSFNGFTDEAYEKINGKPLLDLKMKALENCLGEEDLEIAISPTIFRDLNEEDLGPLIEMCLEHTPRITQVRIRGACRVGRHGLFSPLSTSELLGVVASAIGRTVPDLLRDFENDRQDRFHGIYQFNMAGVFHPNPEDRALSFWSSAFYNKEDNVGALEDDICKKMSGSDVGEEEEGLRVLHINTWGWPDRTNLDFQEIWSHGLAHYAAENKKLINFGEAIMIAEEL